MSAADPSGAQLLVVVDPVARRVDGESTRIARDVLCAGAVAKIALPGGPEEVARAVARRGRRRIVVIGDDRALLRVVALLHRRRELTETPLAWVPVGALPTVTVARTLGVPLGAVAAARAVLDGEQHRLGLLADEDDGVVLGGLWAPAGAAATAAHRHAPARTPAEAAVRTAARTALTLLTGPSSGRHAVPGAGLRLRIEADGEVLADLDRPLGRVSVSAGPDGAADVVVHAPAASPEPLRVRARTVTLSGPDFRYRADNRVRGPVRTRTWTALPEAWRLTLPRG
ncbi:diacylglycerol kinase [Streptomyces sp. NPDC049555]|uniref:diacylglycerol kinase n=1 Tax=unclassified Streptomyces TaxID=2593676 RepID=UPI00343159D8